MSWSRRFEEPTLLPDGRKLRTLAETMARLAKEVPKSERKMEKVQTAAYCVTRAAAQDLRPNGDPAGAPSASSARLQSRSQRPTLGSAGARYVMAAYLPFIRRHRRTASVHSPCRNASAHNPDRRNAFARSPCRNAFARSRDPHHVWARCRFVQKPRGTVR